MHSKSNATRSLPSSLARLLSIGFLGALASHAARPARAQQTAVSNPPRIRQAVDNSVLTTLKGNVHPLAQARYDQGPANASLTADRMELVLKRSPGQELALRQTLASLQDPNTPSYRKWLTPEQLGARFGAADADVQTVSTWLTSQGFKVAKVNKAKTLIEFSGTIGQLEAAFHTQIHTFVVHGEQHLANVSDPQIPTALAPVVAGLSRMNNFFPKPMHRQPETGKYDKATHRMIPAVTVGSASSGYQLFVGPGDAATIYDTPNSLNANFTGSTLYNGANVAIGLIGFSDVNLSDIANYRSVFGLPAAAPTVVVDGSDPGADNGDGELESTLDLEASGALAPGATQYFYIAADTNLDAGIQLEITRALDDNVVNILSMSAGECELFDGESSNEYFYESWEQAAAQGISVSVSAGDNGSAGCEDFNTEQQALYGLQVSGWASTPFNIAVGGTDFDVLATDFTQYVSATNTGAALTSAKGHIPEEPWNNSTSVNGLLSANKPDADPTSGDTNVVAGSGGASSCVNPLISQDGSSYICQPNPVDGTQLGWSKPSWQTGGSLNIPADGVRDLPDVSFLAGDGLYAASWLVCSSLVSGADCSVDSTGSFGFIGVGGTSAGAPAFAGMLALISQSQGGARLGQANYVLYNLANQASLYGSVFHDVTVGNNSVYCLSGSADCGSNLFETGYDTGTAYDQASGLGSLDVTQLVNNWTKATIAPSTTTFTINGGTAPISVTHGDAVTLSATVAGSGATPSGDVSILTDANEQANTYGANALFFQTLSGGTTGALTYSNLPGGTYSVSAYYGGDIDFGQSTSNSIQVTVAKEDSVLDLFASSGNGSFAPSGSYPYGTYFSIEGQPIGASQVNAQTPAPATGSVLFSDSAGLPPSVSASQALNSAGYAELPIYYWSIGGHSVGASYAGDNSFNASAATPVAFTITPATTASTVTSSATTVNNGTFTVATVITPTPASGAANPIGTVTLTLGSTTLATAPVVSASDPNTGASLGTATITVNASSLASGANTLTATYSGDINYGGSSGTVSVTYAPASASFALTSTSATVSSPGQSGSSTVTVTPSGGYTGTVNLACALTTSPTGADATYNPTCSLSASSVTISSSTAGTVTATFATQAATSGALAYPQTNRWFTAAGGAALACVLFFGIPARRRGWRSMLALLVFLVGMAGVGCGGGNNSGGGGGTPGTNTGTYTFTVTGTDSVTATTTSSTVVTLTVQ